MVTERILNRAAWCLALVLGQASLLLGVMLSLGWSVAFTLSIPHRESAWATGPRLLLPIEPPLIGLGLAVLGLVIAWTSRQRISRFAIAGLVFNALPLAQALLLLWLKAGR